LQIIQDYVHAKVDRESDFMRAKKVQATTRKKYQVSEHCQDSTKTFPFSGSHNCSSQQTKMD